VTPDTVLGIWEPGHLPPSRVERFRLRIDRQFEEKLRYLPGLQLNPP